MAQHQQITIQATIDLSTNALETIVENAKSLVGRNEKGYYRVDTADMVGQMISRFLAEKDFDTWVADLKNYPEL